MQTSDTNRGIDGKGVGDSPTVCDVFVSYDSANGGEGPDCPMCKVHRLHGNYDKVFDACLRIVTGWACSAAAAEGVDALTRADTVDCVVFGWFHLAVCTI